MEESLMVLISQASHFQEIVEQRFSTDVLSMQTTVEELATAKERHEAAIQQLLTSMQETREAVRRLEVVEGAARQQTEEATIALRQTIEEYSRRQMVTMQQLLQELARIARSEPGDRLDNV
jgi:ribosomal protein L13